MTRSESDISRTLYIDLLKRALTNWIHGHEEFVPVQTTPIGRLLGPMMYPRGAELVRIQRFDEQKRQVGQEWPAPLFAHTMIGMKRLDNLQMCIEKVISDQVAGDLIETGVWKGGATIFMRGVLKAYGENQRRVWVADSFQGLPPPNPNEYPEDKGDIHFMIDSLGVSIDRVKENFAAYGLLDDRVVFLKGWFSDTLPTAPIDRLSILRLDGDMYQSTMVALKSLYDKLSVGGYVIVDDYCIASCRTAITDFRDEMRIKDEIIDIDGTGIFWRRSA
jgi:hypothetical protein